MLTHPTSPDATGVQVGVFEMGEHGLVEMDDPAALFVTSRPDDEDADDRANVGSVVGCTVEGSRPMCVEVQALCTATPLEFPRHRSSGIALDRVFMLLAVLSRCVQRCVCPAS